MDKDALLWTRELVNRLDYPFHSARFWHISFTESDINYIETVIKADKLYRPVTQNVNAYKKAESKEESVQKYNSYEKFYRFVLRGYTAEIEFFERFMNEENCPANVKYFLWCHLGKLRTTLEAYRMYAKEYYGVKDDTNSGFSTADQQRLEFFTELWFRTVCIRKPKKHTVPARKKRKKKRQPRIDGITPKTLQPKLRQNFNTIPTIYMFLEKHTYKR